MEVKEIIECFKYNKGKFEKNAVIEARKKQKEVTEELLIELEKISNNIEVYSQDNNYIFPIYAMYLLAEFREKRAFPIIVKIISQDSTEVDNLLGGLITSGLGSVLASTFDGNIECLYNIISNLEINEYVRSSAFHALDILKKNNLIKDENFFDKIEEMLENELKNDDSFMIIDIVVYIEENKLYDKIPLVKKLYEDFRVDEYIIGGYDSFIDGIYGDKKHSGEKDLIEDTVKSLSWWACFDREEYEKKEIDFKKMFEDVIKIGEKETQKNQKVGRNDPCPCGSGKKYKKCCLGKFETPIATPADPYIKDSLNDYPREGLKNFYDEETILIDEKLYNALKHKAVPIFIKRNYEEETRRDLKNIEEAIELIKEKCKKENINTIDKFNNKISIHYSLDTIIDRYLNILDKCKNEEYEKIQDKKVDFLVQMINIFNFEESLKKAYISNFINVYLEDEEYFYAEKSIKEFIKQLPDMEKYLSVKLSQIYSEKEE